MRRVAIHGYTWSESPRITSFPSSSRARSSKLSGLVAMLQSKERCQPLPAEEVEAVDEVDRNEHRVEGSRCTTGVSSQIGIVQRKVPKGPRGRLITCRRSITKQARPPAIKNKSKGTVLLAHTEHPHDAEPESPVAHEAVAIEASYEVK